LPNLDRGKCDGAKTKQHPGLETAPADISISNPADFASFAVAAPFKNDNPDEHASATSRQQIQALTITSSEQQRHESYPEDGLLAIGKTGESSSTARILQSDSPPQELPGGTVHVRDGGKQDTVPGTTFASGSSSSDVPPPPLRMTSEVANSPILPPIPASSSDFGSLFGVDLPGSSFKANIHTEDIAISTTGSVDLLEPQGYVAVSPTRTLFPSMSQDFQKTNSERATKRQCSITHAQAAELRHRIQMLEEALSRNNEQYHELERKYNDRMKTLEEHAEICPFSR